MYRPNMGLSLFGGASSEVRRCNCSVVVWNACVFTLFYQKSIYLTGGATIHVLYRRAAVWAFLDLDR